jgi:hypothetical protein
MANDEACYLFVGSYRVCILVVAKRILTSSQLRRSNEIKKKSALRESGSVGWWTRIEKGELI